MVSSTSITSMWVRLAAMTLVLAGCAARRDTASAVGRSTEPEQAASAVTPSRTSDPSSLCETDDLQGTSGSWSTGKDSTARPFKLPDPRCLKDVGCPYEPARLPTCATNTPYVELHETSELESLAGRRTTLRGFVRANFIITLAECGNTCCNFGSGDMALVPAGVTSHVIANGVALVDASNPDAFRCKGDDSMECCGFPLDTEVLARGVLVRDRAFLKLFCPQLCAVIPE